VAAMLLPPWPPSLGPAEALERFSATLGKLGLAEPEGWSGLRDFAGRASGPMPAAALLEAILAFLPEKGPLSGASRRNGFARVTLTTCRRAAGVSWSDCIFAESNAGTWPERREPSCWLADEDRRQLSLLGGRLQVALPTSDDRAAQEKRLYCSIARDTRRGSSSRRLSSARRSPRCGLGPMSGLSASCGPRASSREPMAARGPLRGSPRPAFCRGRAPGPCRMGAGLGPKARPGGAL
jgi:hypothetical protein